MSLKDAIARDNIAVFSNLYDFAERLTIQIGTERFVIIGHMQSNSVQNNSGNGGALESVSWTLYTTYPLLTQYRVNTGAKITINDHSYTVDSIADELGVCSVSLRCGQGR